MDDIGAAPPGWYTIVKEIEVNNLKSYDLVAGLGKRQIAENRRSGVQEYNLVDIGR